MTERLDGVGDLCNPTQNLESAQAYKEIEKSLSERRAMVLDWIRKTGGATPDEVAQHFSDTVGGNHNSWAPRCTELKVLGMVVPTPARRLTRQGKWARVLEAVEIVQSPPKGQGKLF